MKRVVLFLVIVVACFFSMAVPAIAEQQSDPVSLAADNYKLIMENDRVRVLEFVGKAGDKVAEHSHPDHVVYTVSGGKGAFTSAGKTTEQTLETGSTHYIPGGSHSVEILEGSDVRVILIELKDGKMAH